MDSHFIYTYGLTGPEISFDIPSSPPGCSELLLGSLKFDLGSSPICPFFSQLDAKSFSALSNSFEQYNSNDKASGVSPSNYTVDSESSFTGHGSDYVASRQLMRHALQEIETVLMAPDTDKPVTSTNLDFGHMAPDTNEPVTSTNLDLGKRKQAQLMKQRSRKWTYESSMETSVVQSRYASSDAIRAAKRQKETLKAPRTDVKQLLIECAEALSENRISDFEILVKEARVAISISGDPIQRLGAYMLEGLVARHEASGPNIYRKLRCRVPEGKELLSYMRLLYDICPYFRFGYMAANGAIAEAIRNEDRIHIIDFQISQGTQWVTLIQALAARPGGPPHVRITGIDDPVSAYARGDNLHLVGEMLSNMSEKFNIPLEFHSLPVYALEVTQEMLDIRHGEALAVSFTLQLHHTPDESVDVNNPRDRLLRMVKGLAPKVTTLVEQESHTNTTPFMMRFMETFEYYSAMFESIDVMLPRNMKERINVEQHCLAKDIVNIIACEGKDRVERHELLGKWRFRLGMAGFKPYPLSSFVNSVIKTLLGYCCEKYSLVESDGGLLLSWKNRNLISASAWN